MKNLTARTLTRLFHSNMSSSICENLTDNPEPVKKWKNCRTRYVCADGNYIELALRTANFKECRKPIKVPKNCVRYVKEKYEKTKCASFFASGTEFSRDIGKVTRGTDAVRTLTLPKTTKCVSSGAFDDMPSLKSVILNDGLEEMSSIAFFGCALSSVYIPKSVTVIRNGVFGHCTKLRNVTFQEGIKLQSIDNGCFSSCPI